MSDALYLCERCLERVMRIDVVAWLERVPCPECGRMMGRQMGPGVERPRKRERNA